MERLFVMLYYEAMNSLSLILERIDAKKRNYALYNFKQTENNALTTFFDLAQELDSLEDFCTLCVAIPKGFFDCDAKLHLIDPKTNDFTLTASTMNAEHLFHTHPPLILMIRGKTMLIDQLPFKTEDDVVGMLEIYPPADLGPHSELFFEKYANRIGYNIHNKFVLNKNIDHLKFIRTLVADIEHNIIGPNIIYKLFLNHLRKKIEKNSELEKKDVRICRKLLSKSGRCGISSV